MPKYIPSLGVSKFTELEDAPKSYSGQAEKIVVVKATEDGLEFALPPSYFISIFTAAENIDKNSAVHLDSVGEIHLANAKMSERLNYIGFAAENIPQNGSGKVILLGKVDGFSGLTPGAIYYLKDGDDVVSIEQNNFNCTIDYFGLTNVWQSFTAVEENISGFLIHAYHPTLPEGSCYGISVWMLQGEGTGGPQVGPTLSASICGGANYWISAFYSNPVIVTPGQKYTVVVNFPTGTAGRFFMHDGNPYPGGRASQGENFDWQFKVYYSKGGKISTSPGTNTVKVGKAISNTELMVPSLT
jgi:hypothetical protein